MDRDLYEYLDWYDFVEFSEVVCAVEEYYSKKKGDDHTSYGELADYWDIAEQYCLEQWILWYEDLTDLIETIEELENFSYSYNEADNYMEICRIANYDARESSDLTDSELIAERVKKRAEEWELQMIKNELEDIDLDDDIFIIDWYWRPRNITRSDCECLIEERLKELYEELESRKNDLRS